MTITANLKKPIEESGKSGVKTYRASYIVEDDADNTVSFTSAQADAATPAYGSLYLGVPCKTKRMTPSSDDTLWEVEVGWDASGGSATENDDDPTNDHAIISWTWSGEEREFAEAHDGTLVQNSAGQFLDPLPRKLIPKSVISYTKVFSVHTDLSAINCKCNLAASTVDGTVFAAKKLLCVGGSEQKFFEFDNLGVEQTYYRLTAQLWEHRTEPWSTDWTDLQYEDLGFYELISGNLVPILDSAGNAIEVAYALNGSGRKASSILFPDVISIKWYDTATFPAWPLI